MAYTASFGGGFSATIAAQSNGSNGSSGGGTDLNGVSGNNFNGLRGASTIASTAGIPDFVANLKVVQGWGSAQVSGVAHYVDVTGFNGAIAKDWGWGVDAGVSFNLPTFGAGDKFLVTGAYTQNAAWYSGLPDGMGGELGTVNGNGQQMALADTYLNSDGHDFATPRIWSVSAEFTITSRRNSRVLSRAAMVR